MSNDIHFHEFVNRLDLNLRSGKNKDDDIILNLSTNFHEKAIIRNSRLNGEWGVGERDEHLFDREDESLNPIVAGTVEFINANAGNVTNFFFFQAKFSNFIF